MNLSAVATNPGGGTQAAVRTWSVNSPATRGYQTVLYLRFATTGASDGIEIDGAVCAFEGVFQPLDYNALNAAPIPAATRTLSKDGKAVIVKLDAPRQVLAVTLSLPGGVELHRADGLVQADKASDSSGFTDVNFGVQLAGASSMAVNQVTSVTVRGIPGNPRIGIAATDLKSPVMFWPTPDAAGQLTLHASSAFAAALQTFLTAQWAHAVKSAQQNPPTPLPSHIDAAIVIQSDAPCRISLSQFNARFHCLLASFPAGGDKQVLRYAGKKVERQAVAIQLPATANVTSATLRVNDSFHPGGASVTADDEDLLNPAPMTQDRGIRISAGSVQSGGQRVNPLGATQVAGIALGVMALAPGTQLGVELQSDGNGAPSGKRLAAASVSLPQTGQQLWALASFAAPVTIPGAPFWILVSATKGSALWLAEIGADPARIFENSGGIPDEAARLDGFQTMIRILPAVSPAPSPNSGQGQAVPGQPIQAHLSIGAASPVSTSQPDGSRKFDLTSQMNAYLASAQSPGIETAAIPLVFTSGAAGLITVYPPHIAYDIQRSTNFD